MIYLGSLVIDLSLMAGASDQAEVPEPLVVAFMWGIEHSVCVFTNIFCIITGAE